AAATATHKQSSPPPPSRARVRGGTVGGTPLMGGGGRSDGGGRSPRPRLPPPKPLRAWHNAFLLPPLLWPRVKPPCRAECAVSASQGGVRAERWPVLTTSTRSGRSERARPTSPVCARAIPPRGGLRDRGPYAPTPTLARTNPNYIFRILFFSIRISSDIATICAKRFQTAMSIAPSASFRLSA